MVWTISSHRVKMVLLCKFILWPSFACKWWRMSYIYTLRLHKMIFFLETDYMERNCCHIFKISWNSSLQDEHFHENLCKGNLFSMFACDRNLVAGPTSKHVTNDKIRPLLSHALSSCIYYETQTTQKTGLKDALNNIFFLSIHALTF